MKDQNHYSFTVKTRDGSQTAIARCNGFTASCTCGPRFAAERAAQKAFESMCQTLAMDPKTYQSGSVEHAGGLFEVNFTKRP